MRSSEKTQKEEKIHHEDNLERHRLARARRHPPDRQALPEAGRGLPEALGKHRTGQLSARGRGDDAGELCRLFPGDARGGAERHGRNVGRVGDRGGSQSRFPCKIQVLPEKRDPFQQDSLTLFGSRRTHQ